MLSLDAMVAVAQLSFNFWPGFSKSACDLFCFDIFSGKNVACARELTD